jgi:hypothetical protein
MSPTRWPPSSASPGWGPTGPPPIGDALIAALSPYLSVGECNKGFLRDDALLFITFISDTEDDKSKTTPADWYKAIVKAKHGDPGAVVTLLVRPQLTLDPPPGCTVRRRPQEQAPRPDHHVPLPRRGRHLRAQLRALLHRRGRSWSVKHAPASSRSDHGLICTSRACGEPPAVT